MKSIIKISHIIIVIIVSMMPLLAQEFRTIKGIVVDDKNEVLIGAIIEEYENQVNRVMSNLDGEFEIIIPESSPIVLRVVFGCSAFYDVLYEVKLEDKDIRIEAYTRKTDKNTKKIRRKLKRKKGKV